MFSCLNLRMIFVFLSLSLFFQPFFPLASQKFSVLFILFAYDLRTSLLPIFPLTEIPYSLDLVSYDLRISLFFTVCICSLASQKFHVLLFWFTYVFVFFSLLSISFPSFKEIPCFLVLVGVWFSYFSPFLRSIFFPSFTEIHCSLHLVCVWSSYFSLLCYLVFP